MNTSRSARRERTAAALLLAPALVGFVLFYAWPTLLAAGLSFTDWNLLSPPRWVGGANYAELMQDGRFWNGMKLSAVYALLNIPLQTVLGLGLAVAMHRLTQSLWVKSVVLMPYLMSNVLVALVWLWLLDPALGWMNHALEVLGASRQGFFGDADQALLTVAVVNTWRHMGLVALLFLAGMQNIPRSLYEAAAVEGASEWAMFRHITWPLLRPVWVFVCITSVTGSFQVFDTIAVTTNGGPLDATRVVVHVIVQNAFSFYRMGYASAMSMVLALVMVLYTVAQMRWSRAGDSDLG